MATFYPNPNEEEEPWIESAAIQGFGFRIWHVIFICFSGVTVLIVLICCCIKIRIPRTKQEIEADHHRKKLARKFREKLKMIQNQDMDAMDLKRALDIIQEDLRKDSKNIEESSVHLFSATSDEKPNLESGMKAEPQQAKSPKNIKKLMKGKLKQVT